MPTDKERVEALEAAYRKLWEEHLALKEEIRKNYAEFKEIRERMGIPEAVVSAPEKTTSSVPQPQVAVQKTTPVKPANRVAQTTEKSSWERYIGEQLLSKIGIAVLVIGVGIGAKYAIDHNLLSPAMRVAGGYLIAAVLGFFAWRFRSKYNAFSAVLVSGAMATTYFMTYAAHVFYHLYPYGLTFALLLLTTIATVYFALRYNQVVIAYFGLVGAYILPPLITHQGSHISSYLFYIALINTGILYIAFLRNWKSLFHIAFGWTLMVMLFWFVVTYKPGDCGLAMVFLWLFFVQFHLLSIVYPLIRKQQFASSELLMLVPNALFMLTAGLYKLTLAVAPEWKLWLYGLTVSGVMTALWQLFRSLRKEDTLLSEAHRMVALTLFTITLLFALDKDWMFSSLFAEALLLGWFNRTLRQQLIDIASLVVLWLAGVYFLQELTSHWFRYQDVPFQNGTFWKFVLTGCAGLIVFHFVRNREEKPADKPLMFSLQLLVFVLIANYLMLSVELGEWFGDHGRALVKEMNDNRMKHEVIASISWTTHMAECALALVYMALMAAFQRFYLKKKASVVWVSLAINAVLVILLYMTVVSEMGRDRLLGSEIFPTYLFARYLALAAIVCLWYWLLRPLKEKRHLPYIHLGALWMLSLEMIQWLDISGNAHSHKLGLSILWTLYAIYILYLGMRKQMASLRIIAMGILGITLLKLFLYDLARLSTIAKTVVFIAVGGLLLTGAYFYQRYNAGGQEKSDNDDVTN